MNNLSLPLSCIVFGCGKSGSRFIKALEYIKVNTAKVNIIAVCDENIERLQKFADKGFAKYASYKRLFDDIKTVDLIFICVNEFAHCEILLSIRKSGISFQRVISEKPLTENIEQAEEVRTLYSEKDITVNFVERYSPIIKDFKDWQKENGVTAVRANFFWGKFRVHDIRKTMGVLSEISHPLDLTLHLMNILPGSIYKLLNAMGQKSDYSPHSSDLLDTVAINMEFSNNCTIAGYSSFVWEKRRRDIVIYLRDKKFQTKYLAILNFDKPVWDLDTLRIYDILKTPGKLSLVLEKKYQECDFPKDVFKLNKILEFILENIRDISAKSNENNLAYLSQAIYIQNILDSISIEIDQQSIKEDLIFQLT